MAKDKKVILKETINTTSTAEQAPKQLDLCPTPEEVKITFAIGVKVNAVSTFSLEVLKEILSEACISEATISSTARSNYGQAKAMYKNLTEFNSNKATFKQNLASEKKLYGKGGSGAAAIKVFEKNYPEKSESEIVREMTNTLKKSKPLPHVRDQDITNVIDIGPNSIRPQNKGRIAALIKIAKAHPDVKNFKHPPNDKGFHFEIDQYE